jgi:hypothetical protein
LLLTLPLNGTLDRQQLTLRARWVEAVAQFLQGYCLAFLKEPAFADLEATFTVRMNTNHADQGLIVRAQDPTKLALIHFPQTGQQFRAKHFWVAL